MPGGHTAEGPLGANHPLEPFPKQFPPNPHPGRPAALQTRARQAPLEAQGSGMVKMLTSCNKETV